MPILVCLYPLRNSFAQQYALKLAIDYCCIDRGYPVWFSEFLWEPNDLVCVEDWLGRSTPCAMEQPFCV